VGVAVAVEHATTQRCRAVTAALAILMLRMFGRAIALLQRLVVAVLVVKEQAVLKLAVVALAVAVATGRKH